MKKLTIETHGAIGDIPAEVWDGLGFKNPFLSHAFLVSLEDAGCIGEGTAWYPAIITAKMDDVVVGGLPLYVKMDSAGEFVFDWSWADAAHRAGLQYYPKAIVAVPFTPVTGDRILVAPDVDEPDDIAEALIRAAIEIANQAGFSSVHFNFFEPDWTTRFDDAEIPVRFGTQYHWYNQTADGDPMSSFDDFLARFRSKRRANIRRERRKLKEAGVTTRVLQGDDITSDDMRRMFGYYRATVHKFYWGHQYLNEDFFVMLGQRFSEHLHLVVTELDGTPFGGTFNVLGNNRLFGRYWGCDQQVNFAHFETCMYTPIEWCIENGVEVFEPGAGGEHKFERGFTPTKTYSAHWISHPSLKEAIGHALHEERGYVDERNEHLKKVSPLKSE